MKAAVFHQPGQPLSIQDIPTPTISSREMLVKGVTAGSVERIFMHLKKAHLWHRQKPSLVMSSPEKSSPLVMT